MIHGRPLWDLLVRMQVPFSSVVDGALEPGVLDSGLERLG